MKIPKILYINLSDKTYFLKEREDLKESLGGTGLATDLFIENVDLNYPPLDSRQPIVLSSGYLTPYFPVATKSIALFYSPLTNSLGESHGGGRLGLAMKLAGIDAIVITGKSEKPCYISIYDSNVNIKPADPIWGLKATESATYIRDKEGMAGMRSILRIGTAGEKKVGFSMVIVDTYRHFGRLGLGALFGSKNIKALVVSGTGIGLDRDVDFEEYKKVFEELHKKVISGSMRKYHEYGTALNILPLNEMNALPTRNLKSGCFEKAEDISGEAFAENNMTRKFACAGCPLGCIHIAMRRNKFANEEEWERNEVSYDYELIYALGSLIGIDDRQKILKMIECTEELGLDAIYTGVFLSWITEAFEKGLLTSTDIELDKIQFGDTEGYMKILQNLIYSNNKFYSIARSGLSELVKIYGGYDFALLVNNNAVAGYHTGYANLIGQSIVGIRNAHTDNAGYSLDQEGKEFDPKTMIDLLIKEEIFRAFFNCTGICLFARKVYDMGLLVKVSEILGYKIKEDHINHIGSKIYLKKFIFKEKTGFDINNYKFPERFFETPAGKKRLSKDFVQEAVNEFKIRIERLKREYNF
ncbi:MAG: aldehyde:ferredoxin oxidoreductase [Proteobacteria bacterium]|nr:aldehyde:ferredoxin oxidoreductase [Pseudomonadota bacterium]